MHDHDHHHHHGPGLGLFLLIPAAVLVAKGASRRRAMWHSAWTGPGQGHSDPSTFRLPPKIEWMLETWHTRAHAKDQPAEAPTS